MQTNDKDRVSPRELLVRAGEFCAEAIEQCSITATTYRDTAPRSARALRIGLRWLEQCERIRIAVPLVPHEAQQRRVSTLSRDARGLVAPSRVVAIEYEHSGVYDVTHDYTHALATRRIALVHRVESEQGVDAHLMPGFERTQTDEGGLLVWPVTFHDEKNEWSFAPGAALVPDHPARDWLALAPDRLLDRLRLRFRSPADGPLQVRYIDMLPELIEKLGADHAPRIIEEGCMDALWAALGTFNALGCGNVALLDGVPMLRGWRRSAPLDPFHGRRETGIARGARWRQGVTALPLAPAAPPRA